MQIGDVLLCRDDNGSLLTVAKLIEGGVEVNKQTFSAPHFEQLAGPKERLVCSDGRSLADAGFESAAPSPEPPLLDDHNDEFCFVCALGGDLICCETCPNTFHTECVGLKEVPQGDWHCPACCCARCGGAAFDPPVEYSPARHVPCKGNFTLLPANNAPVKQENGSTQAAEAIKKEENGDSSLVGGCLHFKKSLLPAGPFVCKPAAPMQPTLNGLAGSGSLDGMKPAVPALQTAIDSSNIPGAAEVRCCGGGPRLHYACLPKDQREALAHSGPWFASIEEAQRARHVADCCAMGRISVTRIPPSDCSSGGDLTFQLIHCAAASGAECNGIVPGYTEEQKQDLRKILSAALCILRANYRQIKDSRTGADVLQWLLRGASFSNGAADYSNAHIAVLFLDNVIAGVACLRSLCDGIIELPLFTIRQELRHNKLGEIFLSRVETVMEKAGFRAILTPALVVPGWPLSPSAFSHDQPIPGAAQARWGYRLATSAEMQKLAKHRPLAFPGVFVCIKNFQGPGAAAPVMPHATPAALNLPPEMNVKFLQDRKLIAFKYDTGTGAEVKMMAPPGDELFVKPGEGLRSALAEARYKRQLEGYEDLMDDEEVIIGTNNGGGKGRRGRPPGRKNSVTVAKATAEKSEKAELTERHRNQTMAQVQAMMTAQQQAQQLMMGTGLPLMMPPPAAAAGVAGAGVSAPTGLNPQVPGFSPAAAATAAQQASQQAAALNYYNQVNPAMNPQYLALQQLQAAQAQSIAAMESRLRMDQANLAAQMYAMQQQLPPPMPLPQTFAGIPQQQQQPQQQAPPPQQFPPGMTWPPNFVGNPYQGPSG